MESGRNMKADMFSRYSPAHLITAKFSKFFIGSREASDRNLPSLSHDRRFNARHRARVRDVQIHTPDPPSPPPIDLENPPGPPSPSVTDPSGSPPRREMHLD